MLRLRSVLALTAVAAGVLVSSAAFADEAPPPAAAPAHAEAHGETEFGNAGVINFGAQTSLDLAFGSTKAPDAAGGGKVSTTRFSISPSIDYFVIDNLSIGALVGFATQSSKAEGASDSDNITAISVGPRVGYNLWLTPGTLSLWPQLSFLYTSTSTKFAGKEGSGNKTGIDVFVPLLIHPVKHFHFAVGPFFGLDLSSKSKAVGATDSVDGDKDTTFGLRGEIAGWL